MLAMRFGIGASALKRPDLTYSDILHIVRTGDLLGADAAGLLWWLGTTLQGVDAEVAAFVTDEGDAVIVIHAFPMRWRKR